MPFKLDKWKVNSVTKLKRTFKELFKKRFSRESQIDRYLAEASNLQEIERRQRELDRHFR